MAAWESNIAIMSFLNLVNEPKGFPRPMYMRGAAMPVINSWISLTSLDFGAKDSHKGAAAKPMVITFLGGLIVKFLRVYCLLLVYIFMGFYLYLDLRVLRV